jgi:hypothetical protein
MLRNHGSLISKGPDAHLSSLIFDKNGFPLASGGKNEKSKLRIKGVGLWGGEGVVCEESNGCFGNSVEMRPRPHSVNDG